MAHASSNLDEVVARAYELNFTHFHLSEHVPRFRDQDLYPEEKEAGFTSIELEEQFRLYLVKARKMQSLYASKERPMCILVGCETENIVSPQSLDKLISILGTTDPTSIPPPCIGMGTVDYIVGSVHHAYEIPIDFDKSTFEKAIHKGGHVGLLSHYLDAQYEVMYRLRPEIIGHMDLFRLFDPDGPWLPDPSTSEGAIISQKMERNIRFAASYGALFEANSAAFRKGWRHETYPGQHLLRLIKSLQGRIALSDDSHGTKQIALNFSRLRSYLLRENIEEIWYLTPGEPPSLSDDAMTTFYASETARRERELSEFPGLNAPDHFPRGTRAIRLHGWHSAPFWQTLPSELQTPEPP
ncbi:histidinol-phosphatase [Malassezia nana]|uniref:Histidinol-phosphatase n=1 Tax=Malassezia nana TaxID=180528 RepID=A0AAF0J554_9BASI|nr:histidinol-phosphatase [Malassezia nana]